jgi:hypothetical protein
MRGDGASALAAYDRALAERPGYEDARKARELVAARVRPATP